jgi:TonB family protein
MKKAKVPLYLWTGLLQRFQGILGVEFPQNSVLMLEQNTLAPKPRRAAAAQPPAPAPVDSKQRGLMIGALCLLLLALGIVFWHDRDFWFPVAPDVESEEADNPPAAAAAPLDQPDQPSDTSATPVPATNAPAIKRKHRRTRASRLATPKTAIADAHLVADDDRPAGAVITRTVLPPLEVEVIAGDTHRTLRPGSNSIHVELQPGAPPEPAVDPAVAAPTETAANLTSNAAERVQMSVDTSQVVARPVKPSYPLLARQMKVQGSVILQALVGKDGVIQNLRVLSGPPILATAAQDAVRQWHFKPHLENNEPVETEAKITVNFTISTN